MKAVWATYLRELRAYFFSPLAYLVLFFFLVINGITFLTPLWLRTPCVPLVHHVHREHYAEELGTLGKVAAVLLETLPLRYLYRRSRFLTVSKATAGVILREPAASGQGFASFVE